MIFITDTLSIVSMYCPVFGFAGLAATGRSILP